MSKSEEATYNKSVGRVMTVLIKALKAQPESAKAKAHALMSVRALVMAEFFSANGMDHPDYMDLMVSTGGTEALTIANRMPEGRKPLTHGRSGGSHG